MQYGSISKQADIAQVYQLAVCDRTLAVESIHWHSTIFSLLYGTVFGGLVLGTIVYGFSSGCINQLYALVLIGEDFVHIE